MHSDTNYDSMAGTTGGDIGGGRGGRVQYAVVDTPSASYGAVLTPSTPAASPSGILHGAASTPKSSPFGTTGAAAGLGGGGGGDGTNMRAADSVSKGTSIFCSTLS
jgi:hypothetical protein